jgi:hypothetical protein
MQELNKEENQMVKVMLNDDEDQDFVISSESFIISLDCYEYIYDDSFNSVKMEEGWKIIRGDYK